MVDTVVITPSHAHGAVLVLQAVQEKLALDKSYYGKLLARERGAGPIGALGAMEGDYAAGGMFGA